MSNYNVTSSIDVPDWDVALEALMVDECKKCEFLDLDQVQTLAETYQIRFDDIMVTLFELVIQYQWEYFDESGVKREITRQEVNKLYKHGRIRIEDLGDFEGQWHVVKG